MNFKLFIALLIWLCPNLIFAQDSICYNIDLKEVHHHEITVTIEFPSLSGKPLTLRMPNSSPGRYAIHQFAKNVYAEKAWDASGKPLEIYRISPSEWQISGHNGQATFEYTLFANRADGTYSGIDNRKVHLNMPSTFIYGVGMDNRPVELNIDLSNHPTWQVATQLKPLSENKFWAPDYYYFYDSPTIIGAFDFRRWTSKSQDKDQTIEMAVLHEGTKEELDRYTNWVQKIVEAQKEVYGELPDFDFGRYTFLMSYNPWVSGDGMEHRNSTICSSTRNLKQHAKQLIGTVSHEFFHCWNVERIRPASLEKFNFDQINMSGELWFAEGFTSYYDDLILCRTGIISINEYIEGLTGSFNYVYNFPGRTLRGPIEMSYHAPFVDAASSIDEHNRNNTFISYYSYGAVLGLILDLSIRQNFDTLTLDHYMQYLWKHYGKPEIPYEIKDLENSLINVTQDSAFATSFFEKYIYDSQLPDLQQLLQPFGVNVSLTAPETTITEQLNYSFGPYGATVESQVLKGTPLYEAGLNKGDVITSIDGKQPKRQEDLGSALEVNKSYAIEYIQNGVPSSGKLYTKPSIQFALSIDPKRKEAAKARLERWLKK